MTSAVSSHVFETMGTVVSLRSNGSLTPATATAIEAVFTRWNDLFSLYSPTSELSRIADGTLALVDASAELRDTYATALEWRSRTGGAFTPHRPDGAIDLNGIVKALAIAEAGRILTTTQPVSAPTGWMINCGGDVLVSGEWTVGIANPSDRNGMLASVRLDGEHHAIATSGSAERGDHIWGRAPEFNQVTVVASDIVTADVLATAIIAGGQATLDLATDTWPIDVLATVGGALVATPGIRAILAE